MSDTPHEDTFDHDADAVETVRRLAEESGSTLAARLVAWLTDEPFGDEEPTTIVPTRALAYVLRRTDLVARSFATPCISDVRYARREDEGGTWEFQEWHEFRRTATDGPGYREGTLTQSDATEDLRSPVLLTGDAWDDDLRELYDDTYGLRDVEADTEVA